LSQIDPNHYPTLDSLTGDKQAVEQPADDPAEASRNARMWGLCLDQMNKRS